MATKILKYVWDVHFGTLFSMDLNPLVPSWGAQTMGGATQLLDGRPPRQVAIALPAYPQENKASQRYCWTESCFRVIILPTQTMHY